MFSTRLILNKQNLLDKVSTYQIFKTYVKYFNQVGKAFKSEFRDEKSPSCMIEMIGGDLLYTDFGEGSFRALEFVMRKFGCSFRDAIRRINNDFNIGLSDSDGSLIIPFIGYTANKDLYNCKHVEKSTTEIYVKYASYKDKDIEYWNKFGWTESMLNEASIKPIDFYWLTMKHKNINKMPFAVPQELAYAYDYYRHHEIYRRKLYFPLREADHKWISNVDSSIIQNWDLLSKNGGDLLFITSSKKDSGPFYRIYNQWNSCAPNNEGTFIPEKIFMIKIKPRWKRIILFYDNDTTGIINALKWAKKHQIEAVWLPTGAPKDPSDFWAKHGGREFNYQLQKLIL